MIDPPQQRGQNRQADDENTYLQNYVELTGNESVIDKELGKVGLSKDQRGSYEGENEYQTPGVTSEVSGNLTTSHRV